MPLRILDFWTKATLGPWQLVGPIQYHVHGGASPLAFSTWYFEFIFVTTSFCLFFFFLILVRGQYPPPNIDVGRRGVRYCTGCISEGPISSLKEFFGGSIRLVVPPKKKLGSWFNPLFNKPRLRYHIEAQYLASPNTRPSKQKKYKFEKKKRGKK